ncbi:MAG: glycosyltransferase family 4 protein [Blastocatellia bacterium]|nr:glycosyltransferase family 4 protein [Blastocatellia bacterium]
MSITGKIIKILSLGTGVLLRLGGQKSTREPVLPPSSQAGSDNAGDILLVGFVGGTGGISVMMLELGACLVSRGLRVRIVVPSWETTIDYAERCRQRGVGVERTPLLFERTSRLGQLVNALRFVGRYRAAIIHYHANGDVLHHSFLYAMDLLHAPPSFFTPQGTFDEPLSQLSATHWASAVPRHFKQVICISRRVLRRQLGYGVSKERLRLIYNGVNVDRFASGDARVARQELGAPDRARLIVFSARIEPQKRPLDGVRAFRQIADEFPDAQLVFVGAGSLEVQTRTEAEQAGLSARVYFVGHRDDVPNWLAAANVWLLPTETEGFSLAVIEAMAAGCSIVSTQCPGNDEILVHEENSLVVAVGDVGAMAQALRRLLSDPGLSSKLRGNARETARRYSLYHMVEAHLACYTDAQVDASESNAAANTHATRSFDSTEKG